MIFTIYREFFQDELIAQKRLSDFDETIEKMEKMVDIIKSEADRLTEVCKSFKMARKEAEEEFHGLVPELDNIN